MVQSRTCVQKVARGHVRLALPFGLYVVVRPVKPGDIKTILSCRLQIVIDYTLLYGPRDVSASALSRMRAALGDRDRVCGISFLGPHGDIFRKFIKATKNYQLSRTGVALMCWPRCSLQGPQLQ
jgi:hypothetical protein